MSQHDLNKYKLPDELMRFVDSGFLEVLKEHDSEKYVEFHIPSKVNEITRDHIMAYSVVWIHPDFNEEYCHFFTETPGDLPNFYVERNFSDDAWESINDLETVDDLVSWLEELRASNVA